MSSHPPGPYRRDDPPTGPVPMVGRAPATGWTPGPGPGAGYPQPGPAAPPGTAPVAQPSGPAPRQRRRLSLRSALSGLIAGLVVAVAIGAVLVATGVMSFARPATVDTRPVTLPSRLGALMDAGDAQAALTKTGTANLAKINVIREKTITLTTAAYSKAHSGAATGVRSYADAESSRNVTVIAVRAQSPDLTIGPVTDPESLGLAQNPRRVETVGEVDCIIVATQIVASGRKVDPDNDVSTACQRTGPGLTVQVWGEKFNGTAGRTDMAALVDAAWAAAHID